MTFNVFAKETICTIRKEKKTAATGLPDAVVNIAGRKRMPYTWSFATAANTRDAPIKHPMAALKREVCV